MIPSDNATATACVRVDTWNLRKTRCKWLFTVKGLISSEEPIAAFVIPSRIHSSIRISRVLSGE